MTPFHKQEWSFWVLKNTSRKFVAVYINLKNNPSLPYFCIVMKHLIIIFLFISLSGCKPAFMRISVGNEPFDASTTPAPPDYSNASNWAALPDKKDNADLVPAECSIKEKQATAAADVFFIYPTIFTYKPTGKNKWNADVKDEVLNKKIDESTIKFQPEKFMLRATGRRILPLTLLKTRNGQRKLLILLTQM